VESVAAPAPHLGVSVAGAVRAPGFYWLPQDARVQELIDAAGGLAEDADITDIKLSARLIDATTLSIPRVAKLENEGGVIRGKGRQAQLNPAPYTNSGIGLDIPAAAPSAASVPASTAKPDTGNVAAAAPSSSGKVNVNTASASELDTLPGIGPAFAQRIIEHRPFESIEDLNRVPGIAEKRLEALRDHVTVD
jgi:competence protein ComEA